MLAIYVFGSATIFLFLGIIWKNSDIFNVILRFIFVILAIFGGFEWLGLAGFVVKGK